MERIEVTHSIGHFHSMFILICLSLLPLVFSDYSLECEKGHRVSSIRRASLSTGTGLGTISIDCEKIASEKTTVCTSQPSIPRCDGQLEGCTGSQWLGGINIFEVENATKAVLMDPICCTSSEVRVVPGSCIHDQLNGATLPFDHSLVEDLFYRGFQCWHQIHHKNQTLVNTLSVDLIWKVETCAFESELFPPIDNDPLCEECRCDCGPSRCDGGEAPIKVTHKKKMGECECECSCNFKCL